MKSKSINEHESMSIGLAQSGMMPQFMQMRASNIGRDYSNQQKIRRVSPAPQERFSHLTSNYSFPITPFQGNQYQLPLRNNQTSLQSFESKKNVQNMQDLLARIEKLEMRAERAEKMEFRVEKLEAITKKMQIKNDSRNEDSLQGNENRQNLENCNSKNQDELKQKIKNLITREELQRQLIGLDSAFKTLIKEMKSSTNTEMRDVHTKQKKAMIEVVASQISDKLEAFKESFIADINKRIEAAVSDSFKREFVGKNVMGLSRDKFIGTAIQLKLKEELSYSISGVEKELARMETTYFIDNLGFIMDSNFNYLLDRNDSKIKLTQSHIQTLKRQGLLGSSKGFQ